MNSRHHFRYTTWLALGLSTASPVHAVVYTWSGAVGNWEVAANWLPGGSFVPGPLDTATLAAGITTLNNPTTIGAFNLGGGFLTGLGQLSVTGAANWTAGNVSNSVNFNGPLALSGDGVKSIRGVVNTGAATITTWSGNTQNNGNDIGNTGTFNNNGTFKDENIFNSSLDVFTFNNAGTFAKTWNTLTAVSSRFNNSGLVDVQAGEMRLGYNGLHTGQFNIASGATLNFSGGTDVTLNGATFSGPGLLRLSGAWVQFTNMSPVANPLAFDGGIIIGTATFNGPASWAAGMVDPGATVNFNGSLALNGDGAKSIRGVVNTGAATITTWSGNTQNNGNDIGNTGTFNNNGSFTDSNRFNSVLEVFTFNNAGSFVKANGTLTTVNSSFANTGSVDVQAGTLLLTRVFNSSGLINVQSGATLQSSAAISPPVVALSNSGTLQGNGTVRTATGGVLVNGGILAAGALGEVGHLTLDGGLEMLPAGSIAVDIASLTSFDLLSVSKTVKLAGTIAVNVLPGFTLAQGETFTVLTFDGLRLNGSVFQNLTWSGSNGLGFVADYNLHDVTLRVVAVTEPQSWLLMAAGLFAVTRLPRPLRLRVRA